MTFKLSTVDLNAEANAFAALLNGGFIKIYDGAQPANPQTAVTTQNLLATLAFGPTAFGPASGGVVTANGIAPGVAVHSGTAAWARLVKADGTTVVCDATVGTSATDIVLNSTTVTSGDTVAATSCTYTRT